MITTPSKACFEAIQTLSFESIERLSARDLRMILPCLVRMINCNALTSDRCEISRKNMQKILMRFSDTNNIESLMNLDYVNLELEVKKEIHNRQKVSNYENYLLSSLKKSIDSKNSINVFNSLNYLDKMKLVLNELIQLKYSSLASNNQGIIASLFDPDVYVDEFVDIICCACHAMPNLFTISEVSERLLLVKNGLQMICRLVANFPDSFHEICSKLLISKDQLDENNFVLNHRTAVLRKLCQMNPAEASIIRNEVVEICKLPNLVVMLTLDLMRQNSDQNNSNSDDISFLTGILSSNDIKVKNWFISFIKKKNSDLTNGNCFMELRIQLLKRLRSITDCMLSFNKSSVTEEFLIEPIINEACLMLKLYCALRGVAMMKFNEEETQAISRLIVCRPPDINISVRFVSVGLCMLLAFPQMILSQESEIIEWIKWLINEENYFKRKTNTTASFGEMLLLIAIFFHGNQLAQIGDLVSATIGIKYPLRANDLALIKQNFIQDIFNEQVVTSHAIKVPVTENLSDSISGTLPIHCIFQLLKSRAFTKNKVPIKDWILKQICNCVSPIHHILPSLIEAFVNSILIPNSQSGHMTNEPIAEKDIDHIFNRKVYSFEPKFLELPEFNSIKISRICESHELSDAMKNFEEDLQDLSINNILVKDLKIDLKQRSNLKMKNLNKKNQINNIESTEMNVDYDESNIYSLSNEKFAISISEKIKVLQMQQEDPPVSCLLTTQILLLYYILLYEEIRKNNAKDTSNMIYSSEFISRLPIYYLIQRTQTCPEEYGLLRPPLMRLISNHYSHLCLVKNWFPRFNHSIPNHRQLFNLCDSNQILKIMVNRFSLKKLFISSYACMNSKNYHKFCEPYLYLENLAMLPDEFLWPLATDFIQLLPLILDQDTPRRIRVLVRDVWFRLNHIFPTKLWVMTVNVLNQTKKWMNRKQKIYNWEQIIQSLWIIFKHDHLVYRTPELMEILLHITSGFLKASKISCHEKMLEANQSNKMINDDEKRKLDEICKIAYLGLDSWSIQLLLDCCSTSIDREIMDVTDSQRELSNKRKNLILSNCREVQGLICTHLHQCFIAEWNLAKSITFQGFDRNLIPLVIPGVPSLHICLDFITEILPNHDLAKQAFAINLTSYLCSQYPIPRSYGIAKLCFDVCNIHLNYLTNDKLEIFFLKVLPSLEKICQTFPNLTECLIKLLIILGKKNRALLCSRTPIDSFNTINKLICLDLNIDKEKLQCDQNFIFDQNWLDFYQYTTQMPINETISLAIQKTFAMVCNQPMINRIYVDSIISNRE
ncbi:Integrator complex subunit 2 [Sarcoptes scabiei]|uniref:Integrator complex subunit 2 n=1 Tax=Sarcoptes scabiei TaxID=52283 RepID=A0A834R553_SARSC|nr:Integrator complex subunit 2 [Sarcoptes scabiei]UXI15118.1 ERK [Sarcoptes scabiei]